MEKVFTIELTLSEKLRVLRAYLKKRKVECYQEVGVGLSTWLSWEREHTVPTPKIMDRLQGLTNGWIVAPERDIACTATPNPTKTKINTLKVKATRHHEKYVIKLRDKLDLLRMTARQHGTTLPKHWGVTEMALSYWMRGERNISGKNRAHLIANSWGILEEADFLLIKEGEVMATVGESYAAPEKQKAPLPMPPPPLPTATLAQNILTFPPALPVDDDLFADL